MRKLIILGLVTGLVLGMFAPAEAKKRRKRKPPAVSAPVSIDQKFYLRRSACDAEPASTSLSLQDGADVAGCWWSDAGILYEAFETVFRPLVPEVADVFWQSYAAVDGLPLTIDASKPVTGEITLYNGSCVEDPVCSPVSLTAGQAKLKVILFGTTGGTESELGSFEESFLITPGSTHMSTIEITLDPSLNGTVLETFRLKIFHGGAAYGPGGIEYDEPASFMTMPSFVTASPG